MLESTSCVEFLPLASERRAQFRFQEIGRQQPREAHQSLTGLAATRFLEGDGDQRGGVNVGDAHPLRSARNRLSAPALRAVAGSGLGGARRRTRTPRRSSSSSRSTNTKVRGVFSIGRISAIGSPRRVTVTGVPECTRRSTSEKRALASYVEKEAFIALL